jgi:hypothetical protein
MAQTLLSTVDLDVFGGPSTVEVSADFGQTGERGSRIWVGNGAPELTLTSSQVIKIGDLFINTNTVDKYYSWLYTYTETVGGAAWVRVLKLNPSLFSTISNPTFDAGDATVNIPLLDITSDVSVSPEQFIVRYSMENAAGDPIASSFTYSIETILSVRYLQIRLSAVKYSGTTWSNLTGSHPVHILVSYLS